MTVDDAGNPKTRLPSRHVAEGPSAQHRFDYGVPGLTTEQIRWPFAAAATCWNAAGPCISPLSCASSTATLDLSIR
jgi:hypothetical protein